ncbi:hypothetical protein PR003_g19283 [Phytophthora rubi]|nr:hypothetical protein PR003_g19283 [Phytophthora rubi]
MKKTRRKVFDFVPTLKKAAKVLKPVGSSLKRLEKDDAPIPNVYKLFLDLPAEMEDAGLSSCDLKVAKSLITTRCNFVYGDAHGLACVLDPRYAGKGVEMLTRTAVEEFLGTWHGVNKTNEVVLELTRFQTFLAELRVKSKRRWQLLCDNKLPVFGSQFFYPWIHPLQFAQSSLTEPSRKLVHIFFNAKNINDEELATYSHLEDFLRGNKMMKAVILTNRAVTTILCGLHL